MKIKKNLLLFWLANSIIIYSQAQVKADCDNKFQPLPTSANLIASMQFKPINIHPSDFAINCNITDSLKKLLLYHLRWQWTNKEKESYIDREMEHNKRGNKMEVDQVLGEITNSKDTALLNHLVDSILKVIRLREFKNGNFNSPTHDVMLTIGWLNLKEAIPFLKDSAFKDEVHYPRWAVEFALAKMGNVKLQKKIIAESKKEASKNLHDHNRRAEIFRKLRYLYTQESMFTMHELIDTTTFFDFTTNEDVTTPVGRIVALDLPIWIKNEELKNLVLLVGDEYNYNLKAIMAVKQWMIKNKGKYILGNSRCPY